MLAPRPKITVLLVEDDTLVRMLGTDILEDEGFVVIEAVSADDAMAVLIADRHIDLLFSDIDMPGTMDGVELACLVHQRWPAIKILLTSGHHRLQKADMPDHGAFVSKPWSQGMLVDKVRSTLAAA